MTSSNEAAEPRRVQAGEAYGLFEAGRAVLLDVRDRRLYDNAHLTGARSLPLAELPAAGERLPDFAAPPPGGSLVLYCA